MSKRLGAQGESIVRTHLERRGWRILATNYRCKAGEMDLIAEETTADGVTLAFVEVKTRRSRLHGSPMESVNERKQNKLTLIAQCYLGERNAGGEEPNCRFDVAEVRIGADGLASVTMHRAAFVAV